MKLTNAEKLILVMLADLHQSLGSKGDINPDLVKSAIYNDSLWGLDWAFSGLFDLTEEGTPEHVLEVCNFLDMWGCVEQSWDGLTAAEKEQIGKDAAPFGGQPRFIGFDGNHEGKYATAAYFLTEQLGRYVTFKGRADTNAHSHTLGIHRRMYRVFEPIRPTLIHSSGLMSAAQVAAVLKEWTSE